MLIPIIPHPMKIKCTICDWKTHFVPKGGVLDLKNIPADCPKCNAELEYLSLSNAALDIEELRKK